MLIYQGIILGKYAIKQNLEKGEFKKKIILELGAGTGLLALMLASLGMEYNCQEYNKAKEMR